MNYFHTLEIAAHWAAIGTAAVAIFAYGSYRCDLRRKRLRLEDYLKEEKAKNPAKRTHSAKHLIARLGMTEAEILQASFKSRHIARRVHVNHDTGLADEIIFSYEEKKI